MSGLHYPQCRPGYSHAGRRATQEFNAGDNVIVPKGFNGLWETRDGFFELIVVEATAAAEGAKQFDGVAPESHRQRKRKPTNVARCA